MSKFLQRITMLLCVVAMHGTVNASIIAVVTQSTADGSLQDGVGIDTGTDEIIVGVSDPRIAQVFGSRDKGSAASYESISDVESDVIFFQNGNASFGLQTYSTSITIVDIEFTNTGTEAVRPTLNSQITPAGMGFFLSDCDATDLRECTSNNASANSLFDIAGFGGNPGDLVLSSSFNFRVVAKSDKNGGAGADNEGAVLFSKVGSLELKSNGRGNLHVIEENFDDVSGFLTDFRKTSGDSEKEITFDWGATDFLVEFPEFIQPGEKSVISYITEVSTASLSSCIQDGTDCPVAYGAFGDPIGRGGAAGPRPRSLAFSPMASSIVATSISGIDAGIYQFNLPTFDNGVITYRALSGPGITNPTTVPAPATLALLLFGIVLLRINRQRLSQ